MSFPQLVGGTIHPDSKMVALTDGTIKGCWIMVLQPGHSWLKNAGPTFTTEVVDNIVTIIIRPHKISDTWKPIVLIHELFHAYNRMHRPKESNLNEETYAYLVERQVFDFVFAGKFNKLLDEMIKKFEFQSPKELVKLSQSKRLGDILNFIEEGLEIETSQSKAEQEMRDGFYVISIADRMGERAGLSMESRVATVNDLLMKISLY